jgi:hypothetical protein
LTDDRRSGGSAKAACHVTRWYDFSSVTSSSAHARASGILPASLKARAFAKAWLSADRSAADSFPRAAGALRAAADVLRIATDLPRTRSYRFRWATNFDCQRFDRTAYPDSFSGAGIRVHARRRLWRVLVRLPGPALADLKVATVAEQRVCGRHSDIVENNLCMAMRGFVIAEGGWLALDHENCAYGLVA